MTNESDTAGALDARLAAAAEESPPDSGDQQGLVVDLGEDRADGEREGDTEGAEPARAEAEQPRKTRSEKKRERGEGFARERDFWRQEAERAREREERLLAALEASAQRQQPAAKGVDDDARVAELKQKLDLLVERQAALAAKARDGELSAERLREIAKEANEIEDQKYEVRAELRERRRELEAPRPDPMRQQVERIRARMEVKYADVMDNPRALRYARGEYERMVARGAGETVETAERAFEAARAEFSPQRQTANPAKYTGAGGSGGGGAAPTQTFTMTANHIKMADAAYPHISDPTERYRTYAKALLKRRQSRAGQQQS
ncbi:MAG: hypothetical protein QN163_10885 [Armatimonadota bacterium]|nr:hypothetical protein [Armatimonadota bacterium]